MSGNCCSKVLVADQQSTLQHRIAQQANDLKVNRLARFVLKRSYLADAAPHLQTPHRRVLVQDHRNRIVLGACSGLLAKSSHGDSPSANFAVAGPIESSQALSRRGNDSTKRSGTPSTVGLGRLVQIVATGVLSHSHSHRHDGRRLQAASRRVRANRIEHAVIAQIAIQRRGRLGDQAESTGPSLGRLQVERR